MNKFFPELSNKISSKKIEKGALLKKVRKEEGYTQLVLAEMCGTSDGYISSIERGVRNCGRQLAMKLGIIFDRNYEDFL